ncbi:acyl-CoA/acyl-ACP dehydrogenase [Cellulosimicrobium terreum]|nr:acyl-CoA/acyl-ACP dehydrogenase [Cellulosimicrobium terreum]
MGSTALWRAGVARVRLGLCDRLLERAVERLRGRTVADTPTINLAPVRLTVADAAAAHLEAQVLLDQPDVPGAARLATVDAALDRSLRLVHNLFGASGYVDDEPARLARTIDLLGHVSDSDAREASELGEAPEVASPERPRPATWSGRTTGEPGDVDVDALRAHVRPFARTLREHALRIDRDPAAFGDLLDSGDVPFAQLGGFPPGYLDDPLHLGGRPVYVSTCLERAVVAETMAWGDASVVVGAPGPSMSGVVVDDLADAFQRDRFYSRVAEPGTWTYFALTEPERGSDAGALTTRVEQQDDGSRVLRGHKKYVGNAARASIGVVFARHRNGPLGVGIHLVETDRPGFDAHALPILGMRAVQLSEIHLRGVPLDPADTLGGHLSPSRRGLLGAVRTFNRLRPVVGALAVGVTQAALDYVHAERRTLRADEQQRLDRYAERLVAARALVLAAAAAADRDASDGTLSAAAKAAAVGLAEEVTAAAPTFLGRGARWEHPYLDKLVRDVPGLEMMEGTRTIQRLTLAQGWLQGRARRVDLD